MSLTSVQQIDVVNGHVISSHVINGHVYDYWSLIVDHIICNHLSACLLLSNNIIILVIIYYIDLTYIYCVGALCTYVLYT